MNFTQIRKVVDELAGSAANEVKIETAGMKIHLRFSHSGESPAIVAAPPLDAQTGSEVITAPMPGVVYLSPSPDASPFASQGEQVASGETLLLVEAMKSMLPVRAPCDAIIEEILVSDETAVELAQPLIRLRLVSV